jgi:hypothetical protein
MVYEILMPCNFGNELIVTSDHLRTSLYNSNWIEQSREFKSMMKIFMENAKKPMKISVMGTFELKLETFLRIINSAYSLHAFLKNLDDKIG